MSKNKDSSKPAGGRFVRRVGYAVVGGALLSLLDGRVRAFVGSKLAPVAQYIPGQVAQRNNSNPGK